MKLIMKIILILIVHACSNSKEIGLGDMFKTAMKNQSTSPNFIVINVIDFKTGEILEICCKSHDLNAALNLESKDIIIEDIKYNSNGIPTFTFKTRKALKRLRFYNYEKGIIDSIFQNTNPSIINEILKENVETGYSKTLESNSLKYTENYFEHYLYKNKILTQRDCESGFTVVSNNN